MTTMARALAHPTAYFSGGRSLPAPGEWTYDDYALLPEDGWRYEILRGNLTMTPAPAWKHQSSLRNLVLLLGRYLETDPRGDFAFAPVDVVLPRGLASPVQPDLVFVRSENRSIIGDQLVEGSPDFIVEIVSPTNWLTDRRTKFELYAEAGVAEYWLADPRAHTIEVFTLASGRYELVGCFGQGERARSPVLPGFTPAVDAVFSERLPAV
jgi:Uma2 family endonuclease